MQKRSREIMGANAFYSTAAEAAAAKGATPQQALLSAMKEQTHRQLMKPGNLELERPDPIAEDDEEPMQGSSGSSGLTDTSTPTSPSSSVHETAESQEAA